MDAGKDKKVFHKRKLKQAKNVFNSSIKDENNIFCSVDKINKNLVTKARRSAYAKTNVFIKLYIEVENEIYLYIDKKIDLIYHSPHHL